MIMRKTIITSALILISGLAYSQANISCDQLKKENENLKNTISALKQDTTFLHEKLRYLTITPDDGMQLSTFSSAYNIKFLSCTGDRSAQTIRIEFSIQHNKVNQEFDGDLYNSRAYDQIGNEFRTKEGNTGTNPFDYGNFIPTGVDVKCSVVFRGVIGGTDILKLVLLPVSTKDNDGGTNKIFGNIEMRNVKINWL